VGFHWWRSGNKKRTHNVSEYMLVLAVCVVFYRVQLCNECSILNAIYCLVVTEVEEDDADNEEHSNDGGMLCLNDNICK